MLRQGVIPSAITKIALVQDSATAAHIEVGFAVLAGADQRVCLRSGLHCTHGSPCGWKLRQPFWLKPTPTASLDVKFSCITSRI